MVQLRENTSCMMIQAEELYKQKVDTSYPEEELENQF
jgi:hypothetical protein